MDVKRWERARSFKGGNIVVIEINHFPQRIQRLLNVIDLLRHHFYLVNGAVEGGDAVTVINDAATGAIGTSLMRFSFERV